MQLILKTHSWRQTPLFAVCFSSLSDMSKNSPILSVWCVFICSALSPCHRAKRRLRLKWNGDADCWRNIAGFPYNWPLWIFFYSLCTDFRKLVCVCLPNICHIYHEDFFIAILTVYKSSVGSSGFTQPEGGCLNCPHLPFDWQEQVVAH